MSNETTGFVHCEGLGSRIDKAERADNLKIRIEGLKVDQTYHIRPLIDYQNGRVSGGLPTGDYTIKAIDYFHSLTFQTCFQVEGDDGWYRFSEWLVFSYMRAI